MIFSSELKSVTGDPVPIDAIITRIHAAVEPISRVNFDIFSPNSSHYWKSLVESMEREIGFIEKDAVSFLDDAFKSLRGGTIFHQ